MSNVRLVAITCPIGVESVHTSEEFIAYCARVSNPGNQANHETAPRLLNYLTRNHHWSPFEMSHVVIEINTTRDIARQILRHRSFSFQEFSQRYAAVEAPEAVLLREARLQDCKNRQSSIDVDDQYLQDWWKREQSELLDHSSRVYKAALDKGLAKEVARAVLPEGLTPSRLYMSGSVRSWIHYILLRTEAGTQKEHREIAQQCREELVFAMPTLAEVLRA